MPFYAQDIRAAQLHLKKADPVMKSIIKRVGPFTAKSQRDRFLLLVRSIISQQISVSAARSIMGRIVEAVAPEKITAESLKPFSPEKLRPLGVSPQKARYLVDLTDKVASGQVQLSKLGRLSNDDVVDQLVQVKGIGIWTAQMFLIFALARIDVFPHDDLGIQNAVKKAYGLRKHPDRKKLDRISKPWRPYTSIASWYLWQSLEIDVDGA